ncbi:hypothetical protein EDC18_10241 [Natranaerovirga pectinivora]|uniref:WD40 repeat protein n=1 Tax=Natranaerovirga pectinivora TaxID=682400 RepID=A0A4V6NZU4_9FIRM|nr:hypothetical protein [Natranaerovirga pectinivora]TCT16027.1 hypothetical protein EDC18_10241 [Natranaerovirga pectinivora]
MKKAVIIICIAILLVSVVGCSGGSDQKSDEELRAEIMAELQENTHREIEQEVSNEETQEGQEIKEEGETSQQSTETNTPSKQPSATNNNTSDRILVGTYPGGGNFDFIIEKDKSKEVVVGVPVYYLSMAYNNGDKKLLAKSVNLGMDWPNSIAAILNPTLSNDGKKVYYSTDNTFNAGSGYAANNYFTRVIDLNSLEDYFFESGELITILDDSQGPYKDHIVLKIYSKDNAGNIITVYQIVKPNGDQLVILDTPGNWRANIEAKLGGSASVTPSTEIGDAVRLSGFTNETIRDVNINYSQYSAVIVPFYTGVNTNKLATSPWIDHPEGQVLDFIVFGKLQDVVITRYQHMMDQGEAFEYGVIENTIFNIHSWLPYDSGRYVISGRVHTGGGHFEDVTFALDDMRDSSEYDIILIK